MWFVDRADLDRLLVILAELDGSDLHIKAGAPPRMRIAGALRTLDDEPSFTEEETKQLAESIMQPGILEIFVDKHEVDFAYSLAGTGRFRVNAYYQRSSLALAMRLVRANAATVSELGLPEVVTRLAEEMRGLVLVTGPTGSGKTTTLAAMVDHINETRSVSIVTIEDPVEVLHTDKMAIVNQRELGSDTRDYGTALKRVLRQDPDIVVVGEITDDETMKAVLSVASTGHLVLSTMPTTRAAETISRMVDFFPPFQHRQVRVTLAGCLRGVISQALLERADGRGRVPAVEVVVGTNRVFDYVADPDYAARQLETIMADGEYYGMQTFDQSLFGLYKNGLVSLRDVLAAATDQQEFRISLTTAGLISA